jgi:hypothetical protein
VLFVLRLGRDSDITTDTRQPPTCMSTCRSQCLWKDFCTPDSQFSCKNRTVLSYTVNCHLKCRCTHGVVMMSWADVCSMEMSKSDRHPSSLSSTKMLGGLTSSCKMPLACKRVRPRRASKSTLRTLFHLNVREYAP